MTNTITQTITRYTTIPTEETRMVLRPQTLSIGNEFRNVINSRIIENNSRLPSTPLLESTSVIDRDTIIELNNSTSSERRIELMRTIINQENISDNSQFLIANSTNQVRTYLHDLLIRSASYSNVREEDLYRVGNILLYTISNMNEEGLFIRKIIQFLRENMVQYNTNQIITILENHIPIYNNYLEDLRLATEEQLEERSQEFRQEVNQRILLNRRRVLYAGAGLLGSMALSSIGIPPIGGLLVRSLTSNEAIVSSTSSIGEIIRLRDVWDASLKKILDIIQK